jgi:hypothetical protein
VSFAEINVQVQASVMLDYAGTASASWALPYGRGGIEMWLGSIVLGYRD